MKAKREHIVPLSAQALDILEVMKPISAQREHVFPSRNDPKQAMNSQTANADVIEAALAHSDKNEIRKAYNRSTYLQARIELMSWWGEFVRKN